MPETEGGPFEGPESADPSVFAKVGKTITFANGYKNDGSDPGFKALDANSLGDAIALSGVKKGTKQSIIRGDSVQHFKKNHLTIVDENDTLFVEGDQSETITGNAQHLYSKNFLRAVKGNDSLRVNKKRHIIVLGESKEEYAAKHELTAPEEFEWKSLERGFSFLKLDMAYYAADLHVTEIGVHSVDVDFAATKTGAHELDEFLDLHHGRIAALKNKIAAEIDAALHGNVLISLGLDLPI